MRNAKLFCLSLPLILLVTDLWYSVINNLLTWVTSLPSSPPKEQLGDLPFTPEIAINGLQVSLNFAMALLISFGFFCLALLYKRLSYQQPITLGGFKIVGFLIVLAFSLPALWGLCGQIIHLMNQGSWLSVASDIRSLTIALLLPYPSLFLSICLFKYYRTQHLRMKLA